MRSALIGKKKRPIIEPLKQGVGWCWCEILALLGFLLRPAAPATDRRM